MEGFSTPTGMNQNGMVQFAQTNAFVQFYRKAVHNPQKSAAEGRPVNEAADFVKVIHPGERDFVDREVKEEDKYRWPIQWAAYQNKKEQAPEGTPLDVLFPQNPEIVETLKNTKFFTVDQLASATDMAIQSIGMGGRDWHKKAKKFLDVAQGAQGFHKLQAELEDKESRIRQLEDVVNRLQAKLSDEPEDKPKRGRPRKVAA